MNRYSEIVFLNNIAMLLVSEVCACLRYSVPEMVKAD